MQAKLRVEISEWFDSALVFTDLEIKGLQYKAIINYRLLDQDLVISANKELRDNLRIGASKKEKIHRPVAEKRRVEFCPVFNGIVTALTRTEHTLIISQDEKHEVNIIVDRLKKLLDKQTKEEQKKYLPVLDEETDIAPLVTARSSFIPRINPAPISGKGGAGHLDEAKSLAQAKLLVEKELYKQAKGIFELLGKSKKEYAEFEALHKPQQVKEVVLEPSTPVGRLAPFAIAKEQEKTPNKESKKIEPSKALARTDLTTASEVNHLFNETEGGSCLFVDMMVDEKYRSAFLSMAKARPELLTKTPIRYLFKEYCAKSLFKNKQTILSIALNYSQLKDAVIMLFNDLSDDDLIYLMNKLRESIIIKKNRQKNFVTTYLYDLAQPNNIAILQALSQRYKNFTSLFTIEDLCQIKDVGFLSEYKVSLLEVLSRHQQGCNFLNDLLMVRNPSLIAGIKPEAMFRSIKFTAQEDGGNVTTPFSNILCASEQKNFLNTWLSHVDYVSYIINLFKGKITPIENNFFAENIILPMLDYWLEEKNQPLLKVLKQYPRLISHLLADATQATDHLFNLMLSMLIENPVFHPYLLAHFKDKKLRLSKVDFKKYCNRINMAKFMKEESDAKDLRSPSLAICLTQSPEGIELFHMILVARRDLCDWLATKSELCHVYSTPIFVEEGPRLTCLYQRLKSHARGDDIFSLLLKNNQVLRVSDIDELIIKNRLNFLSVDEYAKVVYVRKNPTLENMKSLLEQPNATRLLFDFSGELDSICFLNEILINDDLSKLLHGAFYDIPEFIREVLPSCFLDYSAKSHDGSIVIYVALFLSSEIGQVMLQKICRDKTYKLTNDFLLDKSTHNSENTNFEVVIENKNLHWILFQIIMNVKCRNDNSAMSLDNLGIFLPAYYDHKFSKGYLLSMACRYAPEFVLLMTEMAQQNKLEDLSACALLFGDANLIRLHFLWLAKYKPAHNVLLNCYKSYPQLLNSKHFPVTLFGLTCSARPNEDDSSPVMCLAQTSAGRELLNLYINRNPKEAAVLAKMGSLFTKYQSANSKLNGLNVLEILALDGARFDIIADLVCLNINLLENLSDDIIVEVITYRPTFNILEKVATSRPALIENLSHATIADIIRIIPVVIDYLPMHIVHAVGDFFEPEKDKDIMDRLARQALQIGMAGLSLGNVGLFGNRPRRISELAEHDTPTTNPNQKHSPRQ